MATELQEAPQPFPLTSLDRLILAQKDNEFEPHTWEDLKEIISTLGILYAVVEILLTLASRAPIGCIEATAFRLTTLSKMVQRCQGEVWQRTQLCHEGEAGMDTYS